MNSQNFQKICDDSFQNVNFFQRCVKKIENYLNVNTTGDPVLHALKNKSIVVRLQSDCYECSKKVCSVQIQDYLKLLKQLPVKCLHYVENFGEISGLKPVCQM